MAFPTHLLVLASETTTTPATTRTQGGLKVGAAKVDATPPEGVPLAGYNYPPRRTDVWPLPYPTKYTTWMNGNVGAWEPIWAKALVIDNGQDRYAIITLDAIGADGTLVRLAHTIAKTLNFSIPFEKCLFSAAHTHSGPGAIGPEFLWAIAPATDLMVPELQFAFATNMAQAMANAEANLQDAVMDIGMGYLTGVTHNRRASISHYVNLGTIDPHLGVIRVDKPDGTPLATVWNYAVHGICYDAPNLKYSGDIMGAVNNWIEHNVGGISFFINADAGDVNPNHEMCLQAPNFAGGPVIGKVVKGVRDKLKPTNQVDMAYASLQTNWGATNLNLTLARLDNCTSGGPLDICTFCEVLDCDVNLHLDSNWVETSPRFTAFHFTINNIHTLLVSTPGEALVELGWQIRNDTEDLGFDQTLLCGYSNNYMGYFATPNEYDIGGYESMMTFWGTKESAWVRQGCYTVASELQPARRTVPQSQAN